MANSNFLSGQQLYIDPKGIPEGRLNILKKQTISYGGNCHRNYLTTGLNYYLVAELAKGDQKFLESLPWRYLIGSKIVVATVDWLCQCFKAKTLIDVGTFLLEQPNNIKRKFEHEESAQLEQQCSSKKLTTSQQAGNHNAEVIEVLRKMQVIYKAGKNTWKDFSYDRAISALRLCGKEITTKEEAMKLPGIGNSMANKIMEIREHGNLQKAQEMLQDEKSQTIAMFCQIWGCGPATAEKWWQLGYKTLDQLKSNLHCLSAQQKIGLKYFDDFKQRIPRDEVTVFGELISNLVPPGVETHLVGSYRRGKISCGDIDVLLLLSSDCHSLSSVLNGLIGDLRREGIITDDLTCIEMRQQHKYMGVARWAGNENPEKLHRRIDVFVAPQCEKAAALMHYTGSALFNRSIRGIAAAKGMYLTEHGLFSNTIRQGKEVIWEGNRLQADTEEDIFRILELPYQSPTERDY